MAVFIVCGFQSNFANSSLILFCVLCFYLHKYGGERLTRKVLEEILDMKLLPLKATIEELTNKMAEFRKFIDEANTK